MALETSRIKFVKSEETGEIIGFISRHPKNKKLMGVPENSIYGKKICVLSEELKGKIIPEVPYDVQLKAMRSGNGYVVVSAVRSQFKPIIETVIIPQSIYRIEITFGFKTVYYDPLDGKSPSSKTKEGVIKLLSEREDIADLNGVIAEFNVQADNLIKTMENDGYRLPVPKKKRKQ